MSSADHVANVLIDEALAGPRLEKPFPTPIFAALVALAAVLLFATLARAQPSPVLSGTYIGDGTSSRTIAGLGFEPDAVIIKADAPSAAVVRTATMPQGHSKALVGATGLLTNHILSLQDGSFTLGDDVAVNGTGVTYHWVAFGATSGRVSLGSYTGNGGARAITGVGFQPALVFVLPEPASAPVHRSASAALTYDFGSGAGTGDGVTTLGADGFSVGGAAVVNAAGATYHYIAWNAAPGDMAVGRYEVDNCVSQCVPTTLTFSGSSARSGTAGNIRTFSVNGITVRVSAFSRLKSSPTWAAAYLGLFPLGLGVTDYGEGDGGFDRHLVDNVDRNNYVLFEFSSPVVVDKAYLDAVSTDSDISVWIGTFDDPFTNHLTLSDSVLGSFAFSEENTGGSQSRWADVNGGAVVGNALVIAARTADPSFNDWFKIGKLALCGCGASSTGPADDRDITGVGFQPGLVVVRGLGSGFTTVYHPEALGALVDGSLSFGGATNAPDLIQQLQADGFQVGSSPDVNGVAPDDDGGATSYAYFAWRQPLAPTLSLIADQSTPEDVATGAIAFSVGDGDTDVDSLSLSATSSDPTLVPNVNIVLGGTGANRTVTLTPLPNASGTTAITLTASDGTFATTETFTLAVTPQNDPPVIGDIPNQTTSEDTAIGPIGVVVDDLETPPGALVLSATSSNPTLLPPADVAFGGAGSLRTITLTPASDQSGSATITVTVSDGAMTSSESFVLVVVPENDPPTVSAIVDQTTAEDTPIGPVPFTVADVETPAADLAVTGTSNHPALVPNGNIVFGGAGANRTVVVTPAPDASGTAMITVTVSDGFATTVETFLVTVTPVNDRPTISNVADQWIDEDTSTGPLGFTVDDVDTAATSLVVTAASSNTTLVPHGGLVFGGSGASRTLSVTPATDGSGTATITVTVSDGQGSSTEVFLVTVNAVNDPPTVSDIPDQVVSEDTATAPLAFTVGDLETAPGSLTVSASSSNKTLVPDTNLAVTGVGVSRTITATPAADQHGTTTITLVVSDGTTTGTESFVLTVTAENDPPTLSSIADQATVEDTPTGVIAFAVGDVETPAAILAVTVGSGDTALVPTANLVLGGGDAGRTLVITPALNQSGTTTITVSVSDGTATTTQTFQLTVAASNDAPTIAGLAKRTVAEDTATGAIPFTVGDVETPAASLVVTVSSANQVLVPSASIVVGGSGGARTLHITPSANQSGTTTITVSVSDGIASTSAAFVLTVTPVNDAPTVSAIDDQQTFEDTAVGPIVFAVDDVETPAGSLVVWARSGNPSLVPDDGITLGGSGTARTVAITPAAGLSGIASITITVSDGTTTSAETFALEVLAENDAPTVSDLADQTTAEDTATPVVAFTVADQETPATALTVSATSSNPTLVPVQNIVFAGTEATRTVVVTPAGNQSGTATITVTVSDGSLTASDTFVLTVTPVNDAPTITDIADQATAEDTPLGPLGFTVQDADNDASTLVVTVTSSNLLLVPLENIAVTGSGADRAISLTPAANQHGTVVVTVTVSDGAATATETFAVTVTAENDPPTVSPVPDQSVGQNTVVGPLPFTVGDVDVDPSSLTVSATSSNQALIPDANIVIGGTGAHRTVTVTPLPDQSGTAVITIIVSDGVTTTVTTFTVTVTLTHLTISGTVTDGVGPVSGITIELSGGATGTTTTDASGHYVFDQVTVGASYTVTPVTHGYDIGQIPVGVGQALIGAGAGYGFIPGAQAVSTVASSQVVNFVATRMFIVSGRVQDLSEGGVEDVTVTLSGDAQATATTDADGRYAFLVAEGGTYTVTPTRADFWFEPVNAVQADVRANVTADFTATSGAFKRYFAEGSTGAFFETTFAVLNPTLAPATVSMRFERSDGTVIVKGMLVPPETRVTVNPEDLPGLEQAEFSTVVASDVPVIADRTMVWDARGYGSHAETSIAKPQTVWYLAEGATIGGFNLFYLVHNPNPEQALVEVRYLLPAPHPAIVKRYPVPANTRYTIWVNQADPVLSAAEVSAVITSLNGMPIIVERAMYLNGSGLVFNAGHAGAGVPGPATRWFLAEGATGPFFDCFILVANPGSTDAKVEAEYLLPDGTTIRKNYTVSGGSRFNIWVDLEDRRLADTAVSTTVTSTNGVPIVVERAMWWPGATTDWHEGHNSVGATQSGAKWGLAEGESGGARHTETYVLVANTSSEKARVRVSVILENGTRLEQQYSLLPKSRFTVPVGEFFPQAMGARYGVMVESLGENPAQLVVERAMYSDSVDDQGHRGTWAAGTGALGTRIR